MNPFAVIWKSIAVAALLTGLVEGIFALDRAYPPPLDRQSGISTEIVDRNGRLLRAFATEEGRWRMNLALENVDPQFLKMLVAFEDQRFWSHSGVDPRALLRAAWQFARNGRIVSGGSTITMQLARLMEPREKRTLSAKLFQIVRALQIERRLTKEQILARYLLIAPYGGNLEGLRAASLAYFGREPARLTTGQAALLVALPQSPERRRPDRYPENASAARDRVLARIAGTGTIDRREVARAAATKVPDHRRALPAFAAHVADAARRVNPHAQRFQVTLLRSVQEALENVAREAAIRLGPKISVAMILADARSGEILGQVGSANFLDAARSGWIDMTSVPRSPGSALKPFIYGLALEEGLVMPETLIEDRPASFNGNYRPRNFDMKYQGDVSIRQALQLSLNVPAVRLLEAVGPTRLMGRFQRAGVKPVLPLGENPGLAIGLGGLGISLKDLVQLYTAFANHGHAAQLFNGVGTDRANTSSANLLQPAAAWHVGDILAGAAPPANASAGEFAYKTGTSYGYRDAWSIGFDGRYVLGVWVGRADGASVPGLTGRSAAAPILFEAFAKTGLRGEPFPPPPPGAVLLSRTELPVSLRRFASAQNALVSAGLQDSDPQIVYPPHGARIELGFDRNGAPSNSTSPVPLVLKLQGGRPPFHWLANGRPLPEISRRRTRSWVPDGPGFSNLTVIDANGNAASIEVFLN